MKTSIKKFQKKIHNNLTQFPLLLITPFFIPSTSLTLSTYLLPIFVHWTDSFVIARSSSWSCSFLVLGLLVIVLYLFLVTFLRTSTIIIEPPKNNKRSYKEHIESFMTCRTIHDKWLHRRVYCCFGMWNDDDTHIATCGREHKGRRHSWSGHEQLFKEKYNHAWNHNYERPLAKESFTQRRSACMFTQSLWTRNKVLVEWTFMYYVNPFTMMSYKVSRMHRVCNSAKPWQEHEHKLGH